jgi:hypothetical protein
MTNQNNWKQLNIYLTEGDRWQHKQLYLALVEEARKQRLTGVTVTRAIAGFVQHERFAPLAFWRYQSICR